MTHSHTHPHSHPEKEKEKKPTEVASTTGDDPHANFWVDTIKLIVCAFGIYVCFIFYGIIQERIYKTRYGPDKEKFPHTFFLLFCQCLSNAAFAFVYNKFFSGRPHEESKAVPMITYFKIGFTYVTAMLSSNYALKFMSYPAQVLAKSSKMVPVMLMRIVQVNISYSIREFLQVFLVTAGIVAFMFFDEKDSKKGGGETSLIGLGLCLFSLIMDGYTSPTQEHVYKHYKIPPSAMQLFMNLWASVITLSILLLTGQFWSGVDFFTRYPELLKEALLLGILNALGQAVILFTIHHFNALIVTTITTTRKLFTLLASVVVYGHHLVLLQWTGVGLVFIGLAMEVAEKYSKYRARKAKIEAVKSQKQG